MKFVQFRPKGPFHILSEKPQSLCKVENRGGEVKAVKTTTKLSTEARLCKLCHQKAAQTLQPSPRQIIVDGQSLKNRPLSAYRIDPSKCKVASGHLWPEGQKLLMLHIRPAETTWYFRDPEDLQEHISLINQYNKNRYDTLKVRN